MRFNLISIIPALLFIKSISILVVVFFNPSWALFYNYEYEALVMANPWIICVRKQCKIIKSIGQAEICRVCLVISLILSLPLGISVLAHIFGLLSSSLPETMPFFTSILCLTNGVIMFLGFIFFHLLVTQLKFLLRMFDMWLNWPSYLILVSSVIYIVVGSIIFHYHLHLLTSKKQPLEKEEVSQNTIVSKSLKSFFASKMTEKSVATKTKATITRGLDVFWHPKFKRSRTSTHGKFQLFKRASISQLSNRSWISEQPWVSQNPKTSSYPMGFKVQPIIMNPLPSVVSDIQSTSSHTKP
ncbi:uncharacterized protein LOC100920296 isoform X1 [Sarcophilus harrisii]|uniref:uncharacterized protein LOC100920296 isoform X1 n=1 Tax=Sarcophilus harrisii TaxID=9305 RepID=UPI00062BABBF|nr:uncharacterized protein LOC100920296 isoform X1 [Sarcophilus harrisii]